MKPFIFKYKEKAQIQDIDFSLVEYNKTLNLNINKLTGEPAILMSMAGTSTGTKTYNETTDSDDNVSIMAVTMTGTYTITEESDSDGRGINSVLSLITVTSTRTMLEATDSD